MTHIFIFQITALLSLIPMMIYATGWHWLVTIIVYFFMGCIGASATFHRLITHKSYQAPKWWEYFGTVCGVLSGHGSSIVWAAVHRAHHRPKKIHIVLHTKVGLKCNFFLCITILMLN
jgi:sn-1 stearoyl-lipid 9-desaturase